MLREHESNQERMFTKHEKSVLKLTSGHQAFPKQRLDQRCDSLILVKTDVEEVKDSFSFTQKVLEHKWKGTESEKITKFNKREHWCDTNDRTNMGIGNLQRINGFRR